MGFEGQSNYGDLFSPELARALVHDLADDAGAFATRRARELAPVAETITDPQHPPGSLRESYRQIPVHRERDGVHDGYASGVESHDFRAIWFEYGTSAHEEEPEHRKALTEPGGDHPFARVRNPGIPAQHIVRRALNDTAAAFAEIAEPRVERWKREQAAAVKR